MWDAFDLDQQQQLSQQEAGDEHSMMDHTLSENPNDDDYVFSMQTDDESEERYSESHKMDIKENQAISLFHIPQEVLNENPDFSRLLQTISNHISPDSGIGKDEEYELEHLERQFEKEKERYFKNTIIIDTIKEMIDDSHHYSEPIQSTLSHIDKLLIKSEIEIGINISDTLDCVNLYGLDSQILSDTINEKGVENLQNNLREYIYPELIQKWEGLYEDLLTFYQPFPEEATNLFADDSKNSKHFSQIISKHLSSIKKEKHLILEQKQKLQEYTFTYFSKLSQCVQILCTLINHYKCGEFRQYDESTLSWLIERTEAMKLKLWYVLIFILFVNNLIVQSNMSILYLFMTRIQYQSITKCTKYLLQIIII
ncbi:predicted protein [Naegleria gruberi]|uniref:Predicted protein n=1 Tax=Naegleria gruberi TaxID=5762 RepID=D2V3A1_NAEGR|nr:uncharacterized protein NAEGRDRAFT_63282 [Naegleria gruberi]EFC48601.1 predicted protein [Naegleria gruberi]|eukprot:XP_002681345.1 predicted protein [Naegleria gruberi strain NEG-M]